MSYLISATILLFAVWPAYYFLLRYSERYTLNRVLLLLAMVAAVALPFVSFDSPAPAVSTTVHATIERVSGLTEPAAEEFREVYMRPRSADVGVDVPLDETTKVYVAPVPAWQLVYSFGFLFLVLVMAIRLAYILLLHLRSRPNGDGSYRLLHPNANPGQAFTFGRTVYFSIDVPDAPDFEHILAHERVHARQAHSLDILLTEVFLCVFWFHPAAWWLRASTRANLEYLVDQSVIRSGQDRRSYQIALVRQSQAAHGLALTLPFSEPSLKSRIARMTGLAEYRVVATLAAVALLFWLGAAVLVINGNVFEQEQTVAATAGTEYLAAHSVPGEVYYDYYHERLPEDITSVKIYTDRMVTMDEYLQLRAIISHVPTARLYVYKHAFDNGYSLEIQTEGKQPAFANELNAYRGDDAYMLGLEGHGNPRNCTPVAIRYTDDVLAEDVNTTVASREAWEASDNRGDYVNERMLSSSEHPLVLVNDEPFTLRDAGEITDGQPVYLNGVNILDYGAEDWLKIRVGGRPEARLTDRMLALLGKKALDFSGGKSYSRTSVAQGTFREWYENVGWPADQPPAAYYHNRAVPLDFLLDTEFGPNAIIHTAVSYDVPLGRYAVQVIDAIDVSQFEARSITYSPGGTPNVFAPDEKNVQLFFRRLPTPEEVMAIREVIRKPYPELEFVVFQDCQYAAGNYTFGLIDEEGTAHTFGNISAGSTTGGLVGFKLDRSAGRSVIQTMSELNARPGTPEADVFAFVSDSPVAITTNDSPYTTNQLDAPPARVALQCLIFNAQDRAGRQVWLSKHRHDMTTALKTLMEKRDEAGYQDRAATFYVNDDAVTLEEFVEYGSGEGSYMQAGTDPNSESSPVVFQIVDPLVR